MSSKGRQHWKLRAENLKYVRNEIKFKIDEADVKKPANEVIQVDGELTITFISKNSYFNGLIIGDQIVKINGSPAKNKSDLAPIFKGQSCTLEINRRDGASPVTKERLKKWELSPNPNFGYFILTYTRPQNVPSTAQMGVVFKALRNRALIVSIEPQSMMSELLTPGDAIVDFEGGQPRWITDITHVKEDIVPFQKTGKLNVLIERPATSANLENSRRYIQSVTPNDDEFKMAPDAKKIGTESSNMHGMILKKLAPPSIYKRKGEIVGKVTKNMHSRTCDEKDNRIKISTASTETRIVSDIENEDELKDVVKKSHAASGVVGFFDVE